MPQSSLEVNKSTTTTMLITNPNTNMPRTNILTMLPKINVNQNTKHKITTRLEHKLSTCQMNEK